MLLREGGGRSEQNTHETMANHSIGEFLCMAVQHNMWKYTELQQHGEGPRTPLLLRPEPRCAWGPPRGPRPGSMKGPLIHTWLPGCLRGDAPTHAWTGAECLPLLQRVEAES